MLLKPEIVMKGNVGNKISKLVYPEGKDFIFTIFDDTDVATLDYIKPIYDFLASINMRTTKSVWPLFYSGDCNDAGSHTLEDKAYAKYIKELDSRGFEIGFHGPTMVSLKREEIIRSFDVFYDVLGKYPRIYAAHSKNRENLYWGASRFSFQIFRMLYSCLSREKNNYYQGHQEWSPYFWGDLAFRHIDYVRNFTYNNINLLNVSTQLPYSIQKKTWVKSWFFTSDADNVEEFNHLISEKNQEKLQNERGVCIITTHFGKGFLNDKALHRKTKKLLLQVKKRNGWFAPVSEVLDFLKLSNNESDISSSRLFMMELKWFFDSLIRRYRRKNYEKTELSYLVREK